MLIGYITKQYSTVKTNSQGVFNTNIDKRKDYILVAMGSRYNGNIKELYYWVMPIDKDRDDIKQLFLSNDNFITIEEFNKQSLGLDD